MDRHELGGEDGRPSVTIAIPTYNRADGYLRATLESVLAQRYAPLEIIVADNGSTDTTAQLVRTYADPRLRYFRHVRPLRPNDNFNFCLNAARGTYFQLLHDDDLIDADFVETCMRARARHGRDVGLIRTGAREIGADGGTLSELANTMGGLSTGALCLAWLRGRTRMFLCASLFQTRALRRLGGFRSKRQLFQDVLAEFRAAAGFGRLDVPDVKASFRKHAQQNTSVVKVADWCEDSLELLEAMCALAPEAAPAIRRAGLRRLAVFNYNLARGMPDPVERYRAFLAIYRNFGYSYSPLRYQARALLRGWRARVRAGVPVAARPR